MAVPLGKALCSAYAAALLLGSVRASVSRTPISRGGCVKHGGSTWSPGSAGAAAPAAGWVTQHVCRWWRRTSWSRRSDAFPLPVAVAGVDSNGLETAVVPCGRLTPTADPNVAAGARGSRRRTAEWILYVAVQFSWIMAEVGGNWRSAQRRIRKPLLRSSNLLAGSADFELVRLTPDKSASADALQGFG